MITPKDALKFVKLLESKKEWNEVVPIKKKYVHKRDNNQVLISNIIEIKKDRIGMVFPEKKDIFVLFCQAKPNLRCPVCFDHPLDHYPLMMIFEIYRQMAIATAHKIYNVPLKGYINIVDSLSFEFSYFAELDIPFIVMCVDVDVEMKEGILYKRLMQFFGVQGGIVCSYGTGSMKVLKKELYLKLRRDSRDSILNKLGINREGGLIPTNIDLLPLKPYMKGVIK